MTKMSRILQLMSAKEKLRQQKALHEAKKFHDEAEKCDQISSQLSDLAKDKSGDSSVLSAGQFHRDRQLIMKLMEQKEILENRKTFLEVELTRSRNEVVKTQIKLDRLENASKSQLLDARNSEQKKFEDNQISQKKENWHKTC